MFKFHVRVKITLVCLSLFSLLSCKRCEQADCTGFETISLDLIHYTNAESDTIIIRKFAQHSNYANQLDSIIAQDTYYSGDTMYLYFVDRQARSLEELKNDYDLELYNPYDQKAIRIFDIDREHATQEVCHGGLLGAGNTSLTCNNRLLGFNYSVNTGTINASANTIFVTK